MRVCVGGCLCFIRQIDDHHTRVTTLAFAKSKFFGPNGCLKPFRGLMRRKLQREIDLDVETLANLANYDPSLEGMKLSRFDKALGLNRERINRIYRGISTGPMSSSYRDPRVGRNVIRVSNSDFNPTLPENRVFLGSHPSEAHPGLAPFACGKRPFRAKTILQALKGRIRLANGASPIGIKLRQIEAFFGCRRSPGLHPGLRERPFQGRKQGSMTVLRP